MTFQKYLLLLIIFFIQGCGTDQTSWHKQSSGTINQKLQERYKVNHADLAVTYDLANKNSDCLYAKNLGIITNNAKQDRIYLQKFQNTSLQEFNQAAGEKITAIKTLVSSLNKKYHFLSKAEASYFAKKHNYKNNIVELTKINKIIISLPLMMPEYAAKVTSHYGFRSSPHKKKRKKNCFHRGIDLQAKKSAPVYAAANGVVIKVARVRDYGNFIEIRHSRKFVTKYAHLKDINIKEGAQVKRGQFIGTQGKTGNAIGEHLHFEISLDNKTINPFDFISHCYKC